MGIDKILLLNELKCGVQVYERNKDDYVVKCKLDVSRLNDAYEELKPKINKYLNL